METSLTPRFLWVCLYDYEYKEEHDTHFEKERLNPQNEEKVVSILIRYECSWTFILF